MQTSTKPIDGFNEVVMTAGWACNGTDGTYSSSIYNTTTFIPPQAGDPNFTPYANLTQDQVLGWIWESGVDKTATQSALDTMIANQVNPPVVTPPLPWATK